MIVQCKKCETKFRFDEAIIGGEGVWMRCGVCKNVFFQDNPLREAARVVVPPVTAAREREAEPVVLKEEPVVVTEERAAEEGRPAPAYPETESPEAAPGAGPEGLASEETLPDEEDMEGEEEEKRGGIGKVVAYALLIVVVLGGVYLWLFSPFTMQELTASFGGRAMPEWVSSLPLADKIFGTAARQKDFVITQVTVQDLKQRIVKNVLLGDLRVLEGTVLNQSEYVISQIQVRGKIYDAAGAVLNERTSACGNILTDEELASMTGDDIQKTLTLLGGRDVSNDQIAPGGRIPFMIVFPNVPPAAAKTTVLPVGAERLLP